MRAREPGRILVWFRDPNWVKRLQEPARFGDSPLELEAYHAAGSAHLLARQSVLRVRGQARVDDARDLWPRHHMAVRAGRVAEHKPGAIVWATAGPAVGATPAVALAQADATFVPASLSFASFLLDLKDGATSRGLFAFR